MITTAVFGTKPHDREQLQRSSAHSGIAWRFLEFRLTKDTAATAQGAQAVCVSDEVLSWMIRRLNIGLRSGPGVES